jgi:hypothetical protein
MAESIRHVISTATGLILELTGSYVYIFILAGSVYLLALVVFQLLVPKLDTIALES